MEKTTNKNLKKVSRIHFFILNTKYLIQREREAFTLIELIVVVAISAIVSVGGFLILYKYSASQNLKLATGEITAVLRNTQKMSVAQENGKQWAVRFSNSTSSGQVFRTWSGLSFASSTANQTYKLRTGVNFGNPVVGKDIDVIFSPITGELSQNQIITLLAGSAGSTVSDIIINPFGKVTTRKEEGLVGYWHLDEATSTIAYDNSGYGNNGTLYNTPMWQLGTNCKAGGCLSFNGTSQYMTADSSSSFNFGNGNFSVGLWFKVNDYTQLSGEKSIINKYNGSYDGWRFEFSGAYLRFSGGDGGGGPFDATGSFTNPVSSNGWYYVVIVVNRTDAKVYGYLNGISNGSLNIGTTTDWDTSMALYIGKQSWASLYFPAGFIDEVRIYNRALSATEILQLYNDIR